MVYISMRSMMSNAHMFAACCSVQLFGNANRRKSVHVFNYTYTTSAAGPNFGCDTDYGIA